MTIKELLNIANKTEKDLPKRYSLEEALVLVKQNGYILQFVHDQTEAICLEAVKEDGNALRHVHNQTEAICLEAVKQHGNALAFVNNQTEAICLEAVKQDGYALRFVNLALFEDDAENTLTIQEIENRLGIKNLKIIK